MVITVMYRCPPHPLTFLFLQDSLQSTFSLKCFLSFPDLQTDVIVLSSQDTSSIPLLQQLPLCISSFYWLLPTSDSEFLEGMDWLIFKFLVCTCHGMDNSVYRVDQWCGIGEELVKIIVWQAIGTLRPVQTWVETLSSQKWLIVVYQG